MALPALAASLAMAASVAAQGGPFDTCPLPTAATLTATPNPVAPSAMTTVRGTGWAGGSTVAVQVNGHSYASAVRRAVASAGGDLSFQLKADDREGRMLLSTQCEGKLGPQVWVTVAAGTTPTAELTLVQPCTGRPQLKPSAYVVSCAEAKARLLQVTWQRWTTESAEGRGLYAVGADRYRAEVKLDRPKHASSSLLFSRLTVRYTLSGRAVTKLFRLPLKPLG